MTGHHQLVVGINNMKKIIIPIDYEHINQINTSALFCKEEREAVAKRQADIFFYSMVIIALVFFSVSFIFFKIWCTYDHGWILLEKRALYTSNQ